MNEKKYMSYQIRLILGMQGWFGVQKINIQKNLTSLGWRKKKLYDSISWCRKSGWQNLTSINDKISQKSRNRGKLSQLGEEYKKLQLLLYLMGNVSRNMETLRKKWK